MSTRFELARPHALFLGVTALALSACTPTIPEGRFACDDHHACPPRFECREDNLCYSRDFKRDDHGGDGMDGGTDASNLPTDAGDQPQSSGDGGDAMPDAAVDLGTAPLRVVHAAIADDVNNLMLQVDELPAFPLAYGDVSAFVPGEPRRVRIRVSDAGQVVRLDTQLELTATSAMVLLSAPAGLSMRVIPVPAPPVDGSRIAAVNAMSVGLSVVFDQQDAMPDPKSLNALEAEPTLDLDGVSKRLLVGFDQGGFIAGFSGLSLDSGSILVLLGDSRRPLIDPRGPRAVVLHGRDALSLLSDPLVTLVHLSTAPVRAIENEAAAAVYPITLCVTDRFQRLNTGDFQFSEITPQIPVSIENGDRFYVLPVAESDCSARPVAEFAVASANLQKGRRYLVPFTGDKDRMVIPDGGLPQAEAGPVPNLVAFPEADREGISENSRLVTFGHAAMLTTEPDTLLRFTPPAPNAAVMLDRADTAGQEQAGSGQDAGSDEQQSIMMEYISAKDLPSGAQLARLHFDVTTHGSRSVFMIATDPLVWHANTVPELMLTVIETFDDQPWTSNVVQGTLEPN
ncbi:MAG: hypothetical protein QM778_34910 [Myxococcales bacterium]